MRVKFELVNGTVVVSFDGEFLGQISRLLSLVSESFPELGLKESDCTEMPWINSTLSWLGLPIGTPIEALLPNGKESALASMYSKGKSDYVKTPIPKEALNSIWTMMGYIKRDLWMQWNLYGGVMEEILPNATAFPHRAGNLFMIQYFVFWTEDGNEATDFHFDVVRSFYEFMAPYVSSSPREAYLNYRDIDVGAKHPSTSKDLDVARTYGSKFFKENFDRLVDVKTKVDPDNFFTYEQKPFAKTVVWRFSPVFGHSNTNKASMLEPSPGHPQQILAYSEANSYEEINFPSENMLNTEASSDPGAQNSQGKHQKFPRKISYSRAIHQVRHAEISIPKLSLEKLYKHILTSGVVPNP
ncbi:hypothetical protein Fmac_005236 [Flemingia macrophylla]|uniref:Berberine/berberine-like domain-containing protein n=1 Tax=Flemingia macrophylla TaxID=520843 RepID=A0ABD1N7R8_9FABA